jgi:hypothetical protein
MTILQSCKPKTSVFSRIFGISDSGERCFHQSHYGCQNLLTWQTRPREVFLDMPPNSRQCARKLEQVLKFVLVAHSTPSSVISILLPFASVPASRLYVAFGRWAYPLVCPSGWNGERLDSRKHFEIFYFFALGIPITKMAM